MRISVAICIGILLGIVMDELRLVLSPQTVGTAQTSHDEHTSPPTVRTPAVVGHPEAATCRPAIHSAPPSDEKHITNGHSDCPSHPAAVPTFRKRRDLGTIAEKLGLKKGVELGVQRGGFASEVLERWPSCEEYVLVDIWKAQANYVDDANVDDSFQEMRYKATLRNTERWATVRKICRNFTTVCAKTFPDDYFDFVYVDARHDRKGCFEDIATYWPKLRSGGVMAGHDYVRQTDLQRNQNWTVNYDGTVDHTWDIVQGAVDEFFMSGTPATNPHYRQVTVGYGEKKWWSWAVRK